ncbi:MAG: hypothetical protein ACT6SF_06140 [Hydrogenophaga sp.]|jgi:hypothetical protein|uniref:hypothetical protein n=1 Tax=Hydrogenophaga sp. TaxID=1904254 RepID=UPI001DB0AB47|nr:hypothetical protein [Hydrogenophaga sp.]MBW0169299.1 hypothetical protein [Hydrogenophaga sp.]MBW0185833.1 hypothetical protein [Hydrogenophaga sp.]
MNMIPSFAQRREPLSYSIDKLGRRDEIVLKSSMRVLDHRFRHRWHCVESGGDVRVTTDAQGDHAGSVVMLYLGSDTIVKSLTIPLPLRAEEVEVAFDHMGDTLLRIRKGQRRGTPQETPHAGALRGTRRHGHPQLPPEALSLPHPLEPGAEVHIDGKRLAGARSPGWLARLRARREPCPDVD